MSVLLNLASLLVSLLLMSGAAHGETNEGSLHGSATTPGAATPEPTAPPALGPATNTPSLTNNLALKAGATLSGSVDRGARGTPLDIVFDPVNQAYAAASPWAEYGVALNQNLGLVSESSPFFWKAQFANYEHLDYITFGGAYGNQPQPHTMWKVQYQDRAGAWITLASGKGGWINAGTFELKLAAPVIASGVRVIAYSDGVNPLVSTHLRGRGAGSDVESSTKAILIQYRANLTPPPPPPVQPVKVILDTDMTLDVDDAGALALLHALADNGEAEILGVLQNSGAYKSAGVIDAINTYYGRPRIPIGAYKGRYEQNSVSPYAAVGETYPNDVLNRDDVPDAALLYRQILAGQPDRSVVIASVGFLTNLENLLNTGPDAVSPLTGLELLNRKVKMISMMAGRYPSGTEFNLAHAGIGPTSKFVIDTLQVPIVFSGWEIGADINTGAGLASTPDQNPVKACYQYYFGGTVKNRSSWDQTSVLFAVRGARFAGREYWKTRSDGYNRVLADGSNQWVTTTTPPAGRQHTYLLPSMSNKDLAQLIETLMIRAPQGSWEGCVGGCSGKSRAILKQ